MGICIALHCALTIQFNPVGIDAALPRRVANGVKNGYQMEPRLGYQWSPNV